MSATDIMPAVRRLLALAKSDTGQSRRAANFLLAWWNGDDCGHFPITDLFAVDTGVAADMALIFSHLGAHPGAVYPDAYGVRTEMEALVRQWRPDIVETLA
jgi:hypothetical protein